MCVCQQDFPVADHVTLSNYQKARCAGDLCTDYSSDAVVVGDAITCVSGSVSIEDISEEVYYDDTQVKTCALGQTKCYKQELSMLVENNWPGTLE